MSTYGHRIPTFALKIHVAMWSLSSESDVTANNYYPMYKCTVAINVNINTAINLHMYTRTRVNCQCFNYGLCATTHGHEEFLESELHVASM